MKTLAKIILALLFLVAGAIKIADPAAFSASIASFKILPECLIPITAFTVPPLEILCAIGLFHPKTEGACLFILCALCACFAILYGQALVRGFTPDCGCFGKNPLLKATPPIGVARSGVLFLLAVSAWAESLRRRSLNDNQDTPVSHQA